jgi:hypothetical protein
LAKLPKRLISAFASGLVSPFGMAKKSSISSSS